MLSRKDKNAQSEVSTNCETYKTGLNHISHDDDALGMEDRSPVAVAGWLVRIFRGLANSDRPSLVSALAVSV